MKTFDYTSAFLSALPTSVGVDGVAVNLYILPNEISQIRYCTGDNKIKLLTESASLDDAALQMVKKLIDRGCVDEGYFGDIFDAHKEV